MFFELRQYRAWPGKRDDLARYMEDVVIPFQIVKGMVVTGSFTGEQEDDLYVWIRRFEDEAEREALYAAVYESDEWKNTISPRVGELLDRSKIVVHRLTPMGKSVMH
ncbi:MAG TPA: NIPSNAP family protein [Tepidiformaceae bacterium]|nr:NIPSNAP family protein [Tepidiformaceae bacterium]